MNEQLDELSLQLKKNFIHYASRCLKIRTKEGTIQSLLLNRAQTYIHSRLEQQKGKTGKVRALILKGRQQGCSTYVGARFYHRTTHHFGTHCFILTHLGDATNNLFEMAQRFYENTPILVRPAVTTNNSKALMFGTLDSGYKIGTAENKAVGRSSTIQLFHGSEVGFWTNAAEHAKGILQAVPDIAGTEIILESTANGVGNYFHQMWQKAEAGLSDFIAIFVPWFWQEEYTRVPPDDFQLTPEEEELANIYSLTSGQLAWRRYKIIDLSVLGQDGIKSFKQEYPCNPDEAFQRTGENSFIDSTIVMKARKASVEKYGPLVLGVDIARFGDDRSCTIFRQGRVAFNVQSYVKKDLMEMTGIVYQLMLKHNPAKVCIDICGLGAGLFDRLKELLPDDNRLVGVNAGSKPLNEKRYYNRRAEMWGTAKEWFDDEPCQIPDDDSLHSDLCNIKYKFDSNSRLVMESKDQMKGRGIRSPDSADAFCLTFALPSTALVPSDAIDPMVDSFAQHYQQRYQAVQRSRK